MLLLLLYLYRSAQRTARQYGGRYPRVRPVNRGTMGVNSLPKTVTRQRRGCDLNPGPTAPESRTLTTRLYRATLEVSPLNPARLSGGAGSGAAEIEFGAF